MTWKSLIKCCFIGCILSGAALPSVSENLNLRPTQNPDSKCALEHSSSLLCFFTPPPGWEIADPRSHSSRVKMAFLKSSHSGFCPSINLAVEKTDVSLSEYLKAVKIIHERDRSNHWRALGKVKTNAGLAQLTEIDSKTEWGPVRILQLIFLKDGYAYVVTASALRDNFSNYYKEIQTAFRSLTLSTDLLGNIPQTERREMLKTRQHQLIQAAEEAISTAKEKKNLLEDISFQEKHWIPFQQSVLSSFNDMGAFWQMLILQNAQEKLLSLSMSNVSENLDLEPSQSSGLEQSNLAPISHGPNGSLFSLKSDSDGQSSAHYLPLLALANFPRFEVSAAYTRRSLKTIGIT